MSEPLQPFAPPTSILPFLSHLGLSPSLVAQGALCLALLFWLVYTVVAMYHWFKYAHAFFTSIVALGIHLAVSLLLVTYILSGITGLSV